MNSFSINKSKATLPAFTLIELLISITIIAIMAALSISAYPKFSDQVNLSGETYKMLAYFRETQSFGTSAMATPGTKFVYGFQIEKGTNTFKRLIWQNPTDTKNASYLNPSNMQVDNSSATLTLKTAFIVAKIDGIITSGSKSTSTLDKAFAFFKRPNPDARLVGTQGSVQEPPTTSKDTESFDRMEITLQSKNYPAFTKKIVILQTGQMYVSDW